LYVYQHSTAPFTSSCANTYLYTCVCIYVCMYTYIYTYIHTFTHTCGRIIIHMHAYIHTYMTFSCSCMYTTWYVCDFWRVLTARAAWFARAAWNCTCCMQHVRKESTYVYTRIHAYKDRYEKNIGDGMNHRFYINVHTRTYTRTRTYALAVTPLCTIIHTH
jgi:hypothetical protein